MVAAGEVVLLAWTTGRVWRLAGALSLDTGDLARHLRRHPAHGKAVPGHLAPSATPLTRELADALALEPPRRAREVDLVLGEVARDLSMLEDSRDSMVKLALFAGAFAALAGFFADHTRGVLFGAWFHALGGLGAGGLVYTLSLRRVARQVARALSGDIDRWVEASVSEEELRAEEPRASSFTRRRR